MNKNMTQGKLFINGTWIQGNGEIFQSFNPYTNEPFWEGRKATQEEIANAFNAATEAQVEWEHTDIATRASYLTAFAKIVEENKSLLSELISQEAGKPLWESLTEVSAVINKISISISAYKERTSEKYIPQPEACGYIRFKPHGVVAVLGPFNFPAHLSNGHIVPALLAGNTVIYKPSELTPAVAEFIMQCWEKSGIPAGVIQCVQGDAQTAQTLLGLPIKGVYFTGSYRTGVRINQLMASRPEVILALEMGGNNPLIIGKTDNIKAAVYPALLSAFITAGQRCTCARRLFIPDDDFGNAFLTAFVSETKKIKIGNYKEKPEPFMGPIISYEHALNFLKAQDNLIQLGGNSLQTMQLKMNNSGLLLPGIIDMTDANEVPDEEIFAPLVQIYRYNTLEEAIALANNTQYGLAAGFIGDEVKHYEKFYQTIHAGVVNWNRPTTGTPSNLPFGGIGHSGNHRPSAYFAADYCAYPIAGLEQATLNIPSTLLPGLDFS